MKITFSDFLQTVSENEGRVLRTVKGNATFRVKRSGVGMRFILNNGNERSGTPEGIQKYLDVFNKTGMLRTSGYPQILRHRSYVPAVIMLWRDRQQADVPLIEEEMIETDMDAEFSTPEGRRMLRTHLRRERSRQLVDKAKRLFRANNDKRLFCEVCLFDFGPTYGEPDFIEAHHRIPLRDCQPGHKTKTSDLAMVCANCHRMLHRGNPWPTVEELKQRPGVRALARR